MAYIDVKNLAALAGVSVTKLLIQMKAAGLSQTKAVDRVSEEEKEKLLSFLRNRDRDVHSDAQPEKLTVRRKSISTLTLNRSSAKKTVNVEIRKKRARPILSYAKQTDAADIASPDNPDSPAGQKDTATVEHTMPLPSAQSASEQDPSPHTVEETKLHAQTDYDNTHSAVKTSSPNSADAAKPDEKSIAVQKLHESALSKKHGITKNKEDEEALQEKTKVKKASKRKPGLIQDKTVKKVDIVRHIVSDEDEEDHDKNLLKPNKNLKKTRKTHLNRVKPDNQHTFNKPMAPTKKEVVLTGPITVGDLAHKLSCKAAFLIKHLMQMGSMVTINHALDVETATVLIEDLGHKVRLDTHEGTEQAILNEIGQPTLIRPRPPVVTVMGHVDHGKTSLLDYIRRTKVVSGESGGITQHIGAYQVDTKHGKITFIDTPGHAAFTKMRARGADATDIVVLVVAADDRVMPQTEEALQHAQAANVPVIVAINKMDRPQADPDKIKKELSVLGVIAEDWGGDVQFVHVSAHTGLGIEHLLEAISLQAEILELKAAQQGPARGMVIESKVDKQRGALSTVLVQSGTLSPEDIIVAGQHYGRIKILLNEHGHRLKQAVPGQPVEILGFDGAPDVGEAFYVVHTEKQARSLIDHRKEQFKLQEEVLRSGTRLENLFSEDGAVQKTLHLVVKADVRGSLEAIKGILADLDGQEVQVRIISSGIGGINESDVHLAKMSRAMIIGFNVRADNQARAQIENESVELRYYSIIYDLMDDVKQAVEGMLAPELREKILGVAEVREVFNSSKFGQIAGSMVVEGTLHRNKKIRVLRDNVVIYEGELESLRRFKEDAQEVRKGTECGIGVKNYNDVRSGDKIEVFDTMQISRKLSVTSS